MSKRGLGPVILVCMIAIITVIAMTAVSAQSEGLVPGPPATPGPVLLTGACADYGEASLRAQGDVTHDGGDWVTRRGFQYAKDDRGDLPDMIPLVNRSFQYGTPPEGWQYTGGTGERTDERAKVGSHSVKFTVEENEYGSVLQTNPVPPERVAERTLTFSAWVWSDAPSRVRVYATYWVGERRTDNMSGFHPGDGRWRWLTLTVSFPAGVTAWNLRAINTTQGAVITTYADGFCAVWGDELGVVFDDGEFGTGPYALDIAGLEAGVQYTIRAFAENEAGIGYGNPAMCKTSG